MRKIPLSPMLKKVWYLIDFKNAIFASTESIRRTLKQIFQGRHPHELRYTFITRAKECGCNAEAVMLWAGHCRDTDVSASRVNRGYTTFSDEFLVRCKSLSIDSFFITQNPHKPLAPLCSLSTRFFILCFYTAVRRRRRRGSPDLLCPCRMRSTPRGDKYLFRLRCACTRGFSA